MRFSWPTHEAPCGYESLAQMDRLLKDNGFEALHWSTVGQAMHVILKSWLGQQQTGIL